MKVNKEPRVSIEYPVFDGVKTEWQKATMRYEGMDKVIVNLNSVDIELTWPELDAIMGLRCLLVLQKEPTAVQKEVQ